ncbi:MAG: rRNA pseudouridine synthase [Myxococcales bacterium]|nr:rRNA pseudouridine synthase [Myxococcales bacterium]
MSEMRLQRFLAQAGVASRRASEALIEAGRVAVNGKVVRELGTKVDPERDRVTFDKRRVLAQDHVWLLLNKPDATVSTASDPEGRTTVLDVVGSQGVRLFPVGRLDFHTQGALLLTNDGELAAALLHPSKKLPRIYHVKVQGQLTPADLAPLRDGVVLDDGKRAAADNVLIIGSTGKHTWLEMMLRQGLNRQIHRMMEAIDRRVLRLIRVSFAGLTVEGLAPGEHRPLTQREVNELRAALSLPGETKREKKRDGRRGRSPSKSKSKTKTKPKVEAKAKTKTKTKTKTNTKAKTKTRTKTRSEASARPKPGARPKSPAKAKSPARAKPPAKAKPRTGRDKAKASSKGKSKAVSRGKRR